MTVFYENYHVDYIRLTKSARECSVILKDYDDLERWIKESAQEKFYSNWPEWSGFVCSEGKYTKKFDDVRCWSFETYGDTRHNKTEYKIHMVKNNSNEIIYSDGKYTQGKCFQTQKMSEFSKRLYNESHNENHEFNFASEDAM